MLCILREFLSRAHAKVWKSHNDFKFGTSIGHFPRDSEVKGLIAFSVFWPCSFTNSTFASTPRLRMSLSRMNRTSTLTATATPRALQPTGASPTSHHRWWSPLLSVVSSSSPSGLPSSSSVSGESAFVNYTFRFSRELSRYLYLYSLLLFPLFLCVCGFRHWLARHRS